MPFTIDQFLKARPYIYHLTSRSNHERIRCTKKLHPASHILSEGGKSHLLTVRRREHTEVEIGGETIQVRDQSPLHEGNIAFDSCWKFADFIQELNSRVFFWPGTANKVIDYGKRHYLRYKKEKPIILRLSLQQVIQQNSQIEPMFCKFNSGSPRCSYGNKSPRGLNTFTSCINAKFNRCNVVEVTFRGTIILPQDCEYANCYEGPWDKLFDV